MKYGIYDTHDGCWMGTSGGPTTFSSEMLAQVAAQVIDCRMRWQPGRCRAKQYEDGPVRERDTAKPKLTAAEALRRVEGGRF